MCVAIVTNAVLQRINAVCQAGRHICGSGEGRVLLLFIASVDLITVTDGFLIRKSVKTLTVTLRQDTGSKEMQFSLQKVEETKQMCAAE